MLPIQFTAGPTALRRIVRQAWRDILSVYYANTPVWRWLKSGALVFFAFFLWTGGSVLMSYRPDWGFLTYVIAYGFALLVWGPLTHFVVVPMAIRLRRTARNPTVQWLARNSSKLNLTVFFAIVIVLGMFTPSVMMLEFAPLMPGDGAGDAGATVVCDVEDDLVVCHLENPRGVDHAVLISGGEELDRADEEPYRLEAPVGDIAETRTGKEFVVELRNAEGDTLRRYVQVI